MANTSLHAAKDAKNDEFYTRLEDINEEMNHYEDKFRGKVVFCNCDDPTWSAFWKYFHLNFKELGLKKLISTYYDKSEPTYKMVYEGGDDNDIEVGIKIPLEGNGDFRNQECIELLKESDIVVTNPPFSLFREYVAQLIEYKKKFLIIGSINVVTNKQFFPFIQSESIWLGYNSVHEFLQPDGSIKKFGNIGWYTNLDIAKRHEQIILWKSYTPEEYPEYVNYPAINVDKVTDIPVDYNGVIGVPVSFMNKYCPEQFEIIGFDQTSRKPIQDCGLPKGTYTPSGSRLYIKESENWYKMCYARILIRRKDDK